MKAYRNIRGSHVQVIQSEPDRADVVEFFVNPEERGKGIGQRLLEQVCREADREGVTLYLEPVPFGAYDTEEEQFYPPGLTYKELCAFYREFGFRFMPKSKIMKRLPKEG